MSRQYELNSILRYEWVFGEHFVSSGGAAATAELLGSVSLSDGARVLDVGGGLGGGAFLLEELHRAQVLAIDLSANMVELAQARGATRASAVEFRVADVLTIVLEPASFELVWSRDTFLHIADKAKLFERLRSWLVPGGTLLFTDYARRAGEVSESFAAYVDAAGYDLRDVDSYADIVQGAGFEVVQPEDWTTRFVAVLREELAKLENGRVAFLERFTEEDFDYLVDRWQRKIDWCERGDMRAVRISAHVPR